MEQVKPDTENDLNTAEAKAAWLRENGMSDIGIAFMLAVEDGEIDGDVIVSK